MNKIGTFVWAALPIVIFSGSASATTLVVNCSTVSGPTELTASILCPQYNLPDALQSISIAVSGQITGSIVLDNTHSTAAQTGSGSVSSAMSFGPLGGFTISNPAFTASYTTGTLALNAGQVITVAGLSGSGSGSLGANSVNFAPYSGNGNFGIPVSTSTLFTASGTGWQFSASQITNANATAQVTYSYGTVPVPAALPLFGSALGLLGWTRRRRT